MNAGTPPAGPLAAPGAFGGSLFLILEGLRVDAGQQVHSQDVSDVPAAKARPVDGPQVRRWPVSAIWQRYECRVLAGTSQWKSPHKCRLSDALLTSIAPERFEQTGAVEPERVGDLIDTHTDVRAAGL
jgi:hypothetical protein